MIGQNAEKAQLIREKVLRQLEHSSAQYATLDAWTARRKELREEFLKGAVGRGHDSDPLP